MWTPEDYEKILYYKKRIVLEGENKLLSTMKDHLKRITIVYKPFNTHPYGSWFEIFPADYDLIDVAINQLIAECIICLITKEDGQWYIVRPTLANLFNSFLH